MNSNDTEVFVYTGEGGAAAVPHDVVRVRVDPSVTSIPAQAFNRCKKLTEVELNEGLVEIGERSFHECFYSITNINDVPTSLKRIRGDAFSFSLRCPIRLHDGIEGIGVGAFADCIFTNFRVPTIITVIPDSMLDGCRAMFSLEISKDVTKIENYAFRYCHCLRNVAFPPNVVFGDEIFIFEGDDDNGYYQMECTDLQLLFGDSNAAIIRKILHRFDGLPIHKLAYYVSYQQGVLQVLIAAINMTSDQSQTLRSKLNPTGSQQDCLGMTPLHILACSTVHNLEIYRVIVDAYPANLITEDRWGALPLLYAFWGAAPDEIIQFLLERYQSLYPDYIFNWTMMVETMGRTETPKESIENLLSLKEMHFPSQLIDWEYLLEMFAQPSRVSFYLVNQERLQFLFMCGMSERVEALPFKVWRGHITNMIYTAAFVYDGDNRSILNRIRDKLAHFENELPKLKEATTILELALWKMKINKNSLEENTTRHQKKIQTNHSIFRQQCHVSCGADVVIGHVLPFLITA
jgi:hypothetical protein